MYTFCGSEDTTRAREICFVDFETSRSGTRSEWFPGFFLRFATLEVVDSVVVPPKLPIRAAWRGSTNIPFSQMQPLPKS